MKITNSAFKVFSRKWSKLAMDAGEADRGARLQMIVELAAQIREALGPEDTAVLASALRNGGMAADAALKQRLPDMERLSPTPGRTPIFPNERRLRAVGFGMGSLARSASAAHRRRLDHRHRQAPVTAAPRRRPGRLHRRAPSMARRGGAEICRLGSAAMPRRASGPPGKRRDCQRAKIRHLAPRPREASRAG